MGDTEVLAGTTRWNVMLVTKETGEEEQDLELNHQEKILS